MRQNVSKEHFPHHSSTAILLLGTTGIIVDATLGHGSPPSLAHHTHTHPASPIARGISVTGKPTIPAPISTGDHLRPLNVFLVLLDSPGLNSLADVLGNTNPFSLNDVHPIIQILCHHMFANSCVPGNSWQAGSFC